MEHSISEDDLAYFMCLIAAERPDNFELKANKELRLLAQTEYARLAGLTENLTAYVANDSHHWNYASFVDSLDSSKGLNNFADAALALAGSHKADGRSWSLLNLNTSPEFLKLKENISEAAKGPLLDPNDLEPFNDLLKRTRDLKVGQKIKEPTYDKQESLVSKSPPFISEHRLLLPANNPLNAIFNAYDRTKPPPAKIPRQDSPIQQQNALLPKPAVEHKPEKNLGFRTAHEQLIVDNLTKNGQNPSNIQQVKKSLGVRLAGGVSNKFTPPYKPNKEESNEKIPYNEESQETLVDERLKNIDPKMVELILNEIMDHGSPITWNDIAGLEFAKKTIQEIVVWPMLRPDIFSGLRGPPKGLLLFGPPGTGKTLIGKCIAAQSKSTFFSISASSLTSKWIGEGEKMVRALFAVARTRQPAVIFIDEIDSLLSQRSETEHESSRRLKTEFLVQLDGATTSSEDRLLVVGATNRPQELDEAARRRLVKRLYIPLPEFQARRQIVENLMASQTNSLTTKQIDDICQRTEGYSGADMANLCKEAALGPIRSISPTQMAYIAVDHVRPIMHEDFLDALSNVRASVSEEDLGGYLEWNKRFGSGGR